jgi:hypothetical protein
MNAYRVKSTGAHMVPEIAYNVRFFLTWPCNITLIFTSFDLR